MSFKQGEFTAIVGPSGPGKTTLLNMIGGLDSPTKGDILIDDVNIVNLTPRQLTDFRLKNIGFVFQSFNLIPVLTTKENIEFIMHLQGKPKEERDKQNYELIDAVGSD